MEAKPPQNGPEVGTFRGVTAQIFPPKCRDHVRRGNHPASSDGTPAIGGVTPDLKALDCFNLEIAIGPRAPVGPEGVVLERFP